MIDLIRLFAKHACDKLEMTEIMIQRQFVYDIHGTESPQIEQEQIQKMTVSVRQLAETFTTITDSVKSVDLKTVPNGYFITIG